jgi:flagellin-like protein
MIKKRGVSPVVATVLLIVLAIVLALIIFLWARGFLAEKTQKFGNPIEDSCERVSFEGEVVETSGQSVISVVNRGNIPIYGMEVRQKGMGSVRTVNSFMTTITIGDTARSEAASIGVFAGDTVILIPMILGEIGGVKKSFTCDIEHGAEMEVK